MKAIYAVLIFLAGFLSAQAGGLASPSITGFSVDAPSDFFQLDNVVVYQDRIVIKIDNPIVSNYEDSGSMVPFLNANANGIGVLPSSGEEINVGDVITYDNGKELVVHRVIEKGEDSEGIYFITKGDNSPVVDGKVRFSQVKSVLVGVLY